MALNRLPSSNNLVPCGRVAIDGSLLLCCCLHPLKNVVAAFNGTQPVLTGHLEADTLSAILHGYCQAELIHRAPYTCDGAIGHHADTTPPCLPHASAKRSFDLLIAIP